MINPCSICSANCCKTYQITVTSFDILRIIENGYNNFAIFSPPTLLSFDPDAVLDFSDDYRGGLLGIKSHPCFFLKDNKCTIHKFAPLSCRRYPYNLGKKINQRFCPFISSILFKMVGVQTTADELNREYQEYKKIVKEWNKLPGKKSDCMQFLLDHTFLAAKERTNKKIDTITTAPPDARSNQ